MLFGTKKSERNNEPLHILTKKNLNVQIPLGTGTNKKCLTKLYWYRYRNVYNFRRRKKRVINRTTEIIPTSDH